MELTLDQALQRGIEAHKAGRAKEADQYYTAILSAQPNHPDANHNMGVLAVGIGRVEAALPFFETALEANASVAQYWLSYLDALIKKDRMDDAKAVLAQAKIAGVEGDAFDRIEKRLVKLNEPNAKSTMKQAKSQDPPQNQMQLLINLYKKGQHQRAVNKASKLLTMFPSSTNLYNFIGVGNRALGKLERAIEAYQKAISINPNLSETHYNMGKALKDQGKLDEAIIAYKKATLLNPDYAQAFNNLGNILHDQGMSKEAIEAFEKALLLKPDHRNAKHMLSALTGNTTETAPKEYVENLFNNYADNFESSLVGKLGYKIPTIVKDVLTESGRNEPLGSVLDLGCGTGLFGSEIKGYCSKLEGIDLSKKMLKVAHQKKVYDKLSQFEIVEYLSSMPLDYDYFIALDVFIYVGDLNEIFRFIKLRNNRSGKLVFSTEHTEQDGCHLLASGRYSHSKSYIESLCNKFCYNISYFSVNNLRKEKEHFLKGGLYVLSF